MAKRKYGSGNLVKRGSIWYLRYRDHAGARIEESTKSSDRREAERLLTIAIGEVAAGLRVRGNPAAAKVRDICQLVIDDYKAKRAATTADVICRVEKHIVPAIGQMSISKLTGSGLRAYANHRMDEGAAPASVNRELAIVRRGLHLAREQEPPWIIRVPKIELLPEDNVRTGFIEQAEYVALRAALPAHLQIALVIGYHVGIRVGTIRALRLDQVDLAAKVIRIENRQVKNRSGHPIPIYGDMAAYIEMAMSANKKYLCEFDGKRLGSFRKSWLTATKKAGVEGLLFHDLRRSAVRNMVAAGIPEETARKITGHKTRSMFQRYNITVERDIQVAGRRMEEYLRLGENLGEVAKKGERTNVQ